MRPVLKILAMAALAAVALEFWNACKDQPRSETAQGEVLYATHCTACHNRNPDKDGSLGPAIKGSSLELVQARVLHGAYPPGYSPKRPTHIMQQLPLTEEDVQAIHAYLNSQP
jgi:mono/diheme cytochrome c family protein